MARVYMLANVLPGKDKSIRDTLKGTKGIKGADVITGQFDIIAVLEAKDTNTIFSSILKEIRKIKGITRTETFVAVD
ncbi:MAG: Lrp/AsnC ligand binding domain-containing protein [Nitrospirae bacterium]|nr:Lrp/AsnC ligand binding domain-containing protein [Nitrospirota bacterium]